VNNLSGNGAKMTIKKANSIYDLLVKYCKALESERASFVCNMTEPDFSCHEWRFRGNLGFGGKFYHDMRISCYPEDRTKDRDAIIDKVNDELKLL
jgi:hypothetical protein